MTHLLLKIVFGNLDLDLDLDFKLIDLKCLDFKSKHFKYFKSFSVNASFRLIIALFVTCCVNLKLFIKVLIKNLDNWHNIFTYVHVVV